MEPHWKEIIPGDQYVVSIDGPLNEGDSRVLTFLYQPLIGPICISLYMTLRHQVEHNHLQSEPVSHYYIMNLLNLNLTDIYIARQKLEAIGLLESYSKEEGDNRSFIYMVKPPLSPNQFFSDGLLNIYLYQKIGRDYYNRLKHFFADTSLDTSGFVNVTKGFQQVFSSGISYPYHDLMDDREQNYTYPTRHEAHPVTVSPEFFDFDLFFAGLNEALVPKRAITNEIKEVILKLAFLYGIDVIQMKNIVQDSMNMENKIDVDTLRKNARDWYTIEHYNSLPKLVDRNQSPIYQSEIDVPKTKEERLIRYLETVSPREFLADLSEGSEPTKSDLRLIEDIMLNQKLSPGVVNVLIHYCMLQNDMKLSKPYVETIASHWARKKVKTVQEAMELGKSEHRKYLERQKVKKEKKSTTTRRKPIRSEQVPDWIENPAQTQPQQSEEERKKFELEKKKLEERLKKYKK